MTPAQMAARLVEVDQVTRKSIQHTADLRRDPSYDDRAWAIDESRCTDQNCTTRRCSCPRRTR